MKHRFQAAFIAVTIAVGGLALAACAPATTHCPVSAKGGDNTKTLLPSTYAVGQSVLVPGTHVTLDGEADPAPPTFATNYYGVSSSSTYKVKVDSASGDQACLAHMDIGYNGSGTQGNGLRNLASNFVTRDVTLSGAHFAYRQEGDDQRISHSQLYSNDASATYGSDACVTHVSGDNLSIEDSFMDCALGFTGNWGTGSDHGVTFNNTTLISDKQWFDQSTSYPFGIDTVSLETNSDGATAQGLDGALAWNPPPGIGTGHCQNVDLYWPSSNVNYSFSPATVLAWNNACTNVHIYYGQHAPNTRYSTSGASAEPDGIS
jgi:hypothetical protein